MNLLHLEYFREAARSEHVQKTGERLHVSPSAVSSGIRSLEQELGVNLFDRVGRNMKLNMGKFSSPISRRCFPPCTMGSTRCRQPAIKSG